MVVVVVVVVMVMVMVMVMGIVMKHVSAMSARVSDVSMTRGRQIANRLCLSSKTVKSHQSV